MRLFHAPREGGDYDIFQPIIIPLGISIHAPREGGDSRLFDKLR